MTTTLRTNHYAIRDTMTRANYKRAARSFGLHPRWWWTTTYLKDECEKVARLLNSTMKVVK